MSEERKFLHDISSPLTCVVLNVENVLALLDENNLENMDECKQMLRSCLTQIGRSTEMIRIRREVLIKGGAK